MEGEKTFHEVMGGRIRRDNRFVIGNKITEDTKEIQQNLMILKEKGIDEKKLAKEMGIGTATLSMAAGGRAGNKPQERFGGLSSTEFVKEKLRELVEK